MNVIKKIQSKLGIKTNDNNNFYKIAVVGSRSFNDYKIIYDNLDIYIKELNINCNIEIVSGGAIGVDQIAKQYAIKNKYKYTEFLPDWNTYGNRAGYMRNEKIWKYSNCGIAFWDGKSKGTQHSFKLAKIYKKSIKIINCNE